MSSEDPGIQSLLVQRPERFLAPSTTPQDGTSIACYTFKPPSSIVSAIKSSNSVVDPYCQLGTGAQFGSHFGFEYSTKLQLSGKGEILNPKANEPRACGWRGTILITTEPRLCKDDHRERLPLRAEGIIRIGDVSLDQSTLNDPDLPQSSLDEWKRSLQEAVCKSLADLIPREIDGQHHFYADPSQQIYMQHFPSCIEVTLPDPSTEEGTTTYKAGIAIDMRVVD